MVSAKNFFILLLGFVYNASAQKKFELIGTTGRQLEGKKIFISNKFTEYSKTENPILDSCVVQNGRFYFTSYLNNPATLVSLYLARPLVGISQFFLEPRKINISITDTYKTNLLDSSLLENAPIDRQDKELNQAKKAWQAQVASYFEKERKLYPTANDSLKSALKNEQQLLFKRETSVIIDFIKKHPAYYISLYWLCYHVTDRTIKQPDSILQLFKQLTPELKKIPEAQAVLQRIKNAISLAQNKILPEFSIPDTSGKMITAAHFKNKYLLIDFWASWCGPCISDFPNVKKVYTQFGNKNLVVLSISLDENKESWLAAVEKYKLPWPQVSELKGWQGPFPKKLDVKYIPQYYLADPQGKFVLMGVSIEKVQQFMSELK